MNITVHQHVSATCRSGRGSMQNMITQLQKKRNLPPLHPPYPLLPLISKAKLCLPLFCLIPYRRSLTLPLTSSPQHPRTRSLSTFSPSPFFPAIIPLFHFSLAQLIGHVCTVTWGPDIIAGQIARRLASDLSQLSCTQTPADWKA